MMATIRQTTYRCDVCGEKQTKRSDLVSVRAEKGTHSYYNDSLKGVKADFCAQCEYMLIVALGPFYGYEETAAMLARPEPKPKKVKDERVDTPNQA